MTLEQIENNPSQKVIIKGLYKQTKVSIQPTKDRNGYYIGIKELSDIEKRELKRWEYALPTDIFVLEDNKEFDLTDKRQRIIWDWVKECQNDLVFSFDEAQKSKTASFYVYVPEEEAKSNIDHKKRRNQAENYILNSNYADLVKRSRILGTPMDNQSHDLIIQFFLNMCDQGSVAVDRIIDLFSNPINGLKILVNDAIDKKLIIKDSKTGIYYYGTVIIGAAMEQVVAWLEEKSNKKVYDLIRKTLYPEFFNEQTIPEIK